MYRLIFIALGQNSDDLVRVPHEERVADRESTPVQVQDRNKPTDQNKRVENQESNADNSEQTENRTPEPVTETPVAGQSQDNSNTTQHKERTLDDSDPLAQPHQDRMVSNEQDDLLSSTGRDPLRVNSSSVCDAKDSNSSSEILNI